MPLPLARATTTHSDSHSSHPGPCELYETIPILSGGAGSRPLSHSGATLSLNPHLSPAAQHNASRTGVIFSEQESTGQPSGRTSPSSSSMNTPLPSRSPRHSLRSTLPRPRRGQKRIAMSPGPPCSSVLTLPRPCVMSNLVGGTYDNAPVAGRDEMRGGDPGRCCASFGGSSDIPSFQSTLPLSCSPSFSLLSWLYQSLSY